MYKELEKLLREVSKGEGIIELKKQVVGSKAKGDKRQLHLYGKREVEIGASRAQQTYVAGIVEQKGYTGLYFMPVYSHPKEFQKFENLQDLLRGKSCFHLKNLDSGMEKELSKMLKQGIKLYKREGWI